MHDNNNNSYDNDNNYFIDVLKLYGQVQVLYYSKNRGDGKSRQIKEFGS